MVSQSRNASEALQQAKRYERGKQILAEGYSFHKDTDTDAIAVCKPGSTAAVYWINLLSVGCDCPDRLQTGKECKHELAYAFLQAETTDEENMWNAICTTWEEENPQLPTTPMYTPEAFLIDLQTRLVADFDQAETQVRSKVLADTWTMQARHKHLRDITGAINTVNKYLNEVWSKQGLDRRQSI